MKISACIVTNMKVDLTSAICALATQFDEIIVVGNAAASTAELSVFHQWETQCCSEKNKVLFSDKPQQSYKRVMAAKSTDADVIFFVDDDAMAENNVRQQISLVFENNSIGLVTGPSLLPPNASLWRRTAQMAVANNPWSGSRYARHAFEDNVSSSRVIGCNMAVRRDAFSGFNPSILPSYGEEWALAEHVKARGYRLTYNPSQIVYHAPHGFIAHSRQVYRWGRTSKTTGGENIDIAIVLYPLVHIWFGLLWGFGRLVSCLPNKQRHRTTPHADGAP